jgi:hypothetical protein
MSLRLNPGDTGSDTLRNPRPQRPDVTDSSRTSSRLHLVWPARSDGPELSVSAGPLSDRRGSTFHLDADPRRFGCADGARTAIYRARWHRGMGVDVGDQATPGPMAQPVGADGAVGDLGQGEGERSEPARRAAAGRATPPMPVRRPARGSRLDE